MATKRSLTFIRTPKPGRMHTSTWDGLMKDSKNTTKPSPNLKRELNCSHATKMPPTRRFTSHKSPLRIRIITTAVDAFQKVADNATYDYDTRRMAQYSVGKIYEDNSETDFAVAAYQKLLTDFPEPHREATHQSNNINENYIRTLRSTGL